VQGREQAPSLRQSGGVASLAEHLDGPIDIHAPSRSPAAEVAERAGVEPAEGGVGEGAGIATATGEVQRLLVDGERVLRPVVLPEGIGLVQQRAETLRLVLGEERERTAEQADGRGGDVAAENGAAAGFGQSLAGSATGCAGHLVETAELHPEPVGRLQVVAHDFVDVVARVTVVAGHSVNQLAYCWCSSARTFLGTAW